MDERRKNRFYTSLRTHESVGVTFKDNDPSKGFEFLFLGEKRYRFDQMVDSIDREQIYANVESTVQDEEDAETWQGNLHRAGSDDWKNNEFNNLPKRSYVEQLISLSQRLKHLITVGYLDSTENYVPQEIRIHFRDTLNDLEKIKINSQLGELSKRNSQSRKGRFSDGIITSTTLDDLFI